MNFTGIAACHSFYWRRYYNSDSLIDAAESVFVQSSRTRSSRWSPYSRTTASASGARGPPGTLVDIETPPIISARSASTVAKIIIKLSNNKEKSRTKESRNFADHLTS